MAVYSMTGYAGASSAGASQSASGPHGPAGDTSGATATGSTVHVELRSVNSRFLDLVFRLPDELRGLEPVLRDLLSGSFKRGKIELRVSSQSASDSTWPQPQAEQLMRLARLESMVQNWLPKAEPLSVNEVMNWCRSPAGSSEQLSEAALKAAKEAISGLKKAREREGKKLATVLRERLERLAELANQAEPLVPASVSRQQQKFIERWQEALHWVEGAKTVSQDALRDRALNEVAAYAVRIDVAEELARLRAHLEEIGHLLDHGGELGKRLDFLIQELLREANTLASKASSLDLTNICVEMKVVIEQLREQVQNIE
jgi:uncharacterized protein (TIGR00255 family)